MTKDLGKFLGVCLLGLLLLLPSNPALADKAVEPMVFKAGDDAIAVISLYETDPATQADAVKSFYKTTKSFYKTIPGFYGLAFFSSTDGLRAVELSQWADQASYNAFQSSLTSDGKDYETYYAQYSKGGKGKGKDKESTDLGDPLLTTSFAIDQVVAPPGMVASIPGSTALVQISDMTTDTAEHQAKLLVSARAALETIPQLYPAPRTAVLLKGIDTPHIALLTYWGSAAEFSDPSQVPQIALATAQSEDDFEKDEAAETVAFTTDSHLYQAIKIIAPKAETDGKG
jgi:heme-degrading monooxygenase HmoA